MAKIAISIPDELLEAVEQERHSTGASRSQVFRSALEEHLRRVQEWEGVQRYKRGHPKDPETRNERGGAESHLHYALEAGAWGEEVWR